ncbi:alpha-galactosidase [Spirochaeta cellobiosiphila]|uniref:alpha-galactosidase n=1 Tax=Spirochaeta cellobiosiphila TaxID=504483 RepID=UPI0004019A04|nr:alpha-galactosidase [Spirochaeta cellobiosiphila]
MGVSFDSEKKQFHLTTCHTSYIMEVLLGKHLVHHYWGQRVKIASAFELPLVEQSSFSPNPEPEHKEISFDTIPREFPDYGRSDYESPAIEVQLADGTHVIAPEYQSHRIQPGSVQPKGLPFIEAETGDSSETLVITLADSFSGLTIELYYTVLEKQDVITRKVVLTNQGEKPITIKRVMSATVDFFRDDHFEIINLYGAWAMERQVCRIPLGRHGHIIDSKRGSSSHEQNPFLALVRPETDEFRGEVYSMNLIYSGSFQAEASVNAHGKTRLQIGLNPIDFSWYLQPDEKFTSPEAVLVYSSRGLNGMSQIYHQLYRTRLYKGYWSKRERPILINNWEATYFDFDQDKIEQLIEESSRLGIELFVLDDGWFGKRNSDKSGLGDWWVNREKLPKGLKALSEAAHSRGMMFGLWFEPEMVSPDSDLYRSHPEWCLSVPGRYRSEGRNQLILDMGREEVQDYLYQRMTSIISENNINYIKWDMNRNMTEVGSPILSSERQKESSHRYILGLYRLLEKLISHFPEVLFESCSGGGGRFDPGMLYYMPQTWTSDNTDSVERLKIQWGTSYVYPPISMGAHVSACPNHQMGRTTSLKTRANVAMAGNMGYELDILTLSDREKKEILQQLSLYKKIRKTVQSGKFIRLRSPYGSASSAWMFLAEDQSEILLFFYLTLATPYNNFDKIRLTGLEEDSLYQDQSGQQYYGDYLMYSGLNLPELKGDFDSQLIIMNRIG